MTRRLSHRLVRNLGLGTLLLIIATLAALATLTAGRMERDLRRSAALRSDLLRVEDLLSGFAEMRGRLTAFVIDEQTDVAPLLRRAKDLVAAADALPGSLRHPDHVESAAALSTRLRKYRAAMGAYAQELQIRRTGEGVRGWERTLLTLESEAHEIGRQLKGAIRDRIAAAGDGMVELGRYNRQLSLVIGACGLAAGLLIALLLRHTLGRPVRELSALADRVAAGDLTPDIGAPGDDELGSLAGALGTMVVRLRDIVVGIVQTARGVEDAAGRLGAVTRNVAEGAQRQQQETQQVATAVTETNSIVEEVGSRVESLTASLDDSASSAAQIAAAIQEVSRLADHSTEQVETITASIAQMSASMGEIVGAVEYLAGSSDTITGAARNLEDGSRQIGAGAAESARLAQAVAQSVEQRGIAAVEHVVQAAERNRTTVAEHIEVVRSLGTRSVEIGEILDVIADVAAKTDLLSLNAAIIAAQAGEHGRGFTVVADEIRELSATTAEHVHQIEAVISGIQVEVDRAVALVEEVRSAADTSAGAAGRAREVLGEVLENSARAATVAAGIVTTAATHVERTGSIHEVVEHNAAQVAAIMTRVQEQKHSGDLALEATRELAAIAQRLKDGANEQASGAELISDAVERAHELSAEIAVAMHQEAATARTISEAIQHISKVSGATVSDTQDLEKMAGTLRHSSEELVNLVKRFQLPDPAGG